MAATSSRRAARDRGPGLQHAGAIASDGPSAASPARGRGASWAGSEKSRTASLAVARDAHMLRASALVGRGGHLHHRAPCSREGAAQRPRQDAVKSPRGIRLRAGAGLQFQRRSLADLRIREDRPFGTDIALRVGEPFLGLRYGRRRHSRQQRSPLQIVGVPAADRGAPVSGGCYSHWGAQHRAARCGRFRCGRK